MTDSGPSDAIRQAMAGVDRPRSGCLVAAVVTLVPTELAALALDVQPGTIRYWASIGVLTRYGSKQKAQYDVAELTTIAVSRDRGEWKPPVRRGA